MNQHSDAEHDHEDPQQDENRYIAQRREKLAQLRARGQAYPNQFERAHFAADLARQYAGLARDELEAQAIEVSLAGRMMFKRIMGKASFAQLRDMTGTMQIFVQRDAIGEDAYEAFKHSDIGDIYGVSGVLFQTRTGELTIKVKTIELLTKALRPLPEKFHGLADQELKYRQRYVDLIMNDDSRRVFAIRSLAVNFIRQYMIEAGFIEVETPMMQVIPGGAAARPFITHHNALDMDLYLRVAPELYLKRLVVGGIEQVFEINRNFRNEGLSTRHNPEFTMLEFYQAYADYEDFMNLTEDMMRRLAHAVLGSGQVHYQGEDFDLDQPFARMSVAESIIHHNPNLDAAKLEDLDYCRKAAADLGIKPEPAWGAGKLQVEIFEKTVEEHLQQPTFITAYPTEVSPLSRCNDDNPFVTDRFEFFLGGRELANGFSELNDPEEQAARFRRQVEEKEAGDEEAMHYDADYVRALEYGLPPTAGEGIGIDRLVMVLTDSPSIRDVILFPHMRPE
ncbi:MAG: lysine--tRNA ligase [Gammaproteobacteria bacterium]|nr:lysine--tRNA ligase [Gammaproteobacteria bacterium]MDH3538237.1 lysine--tRNA ligase [Gammaproteobacteria bacterium]